MGKEDNQSLEVQVAKLKTDVKLLTGACALLVACTLVFAYGYKSHTKAIADVQGSTTQLAASVELLLKEKAITSQLQNEFEEWLATPDGQEWFENHQSTEDSPVE